MFRHKDLQMCGNMSNFQPLEILGLGSETQLQVGENLNINPLSPHDAFKHHFTSLKTDLIFLQLGVLEQKFP